MNAPIHKASQAMTALPDNSPLGEEQLERAWDCFTCWRTFDEGAYPLTRHPETEEPECGDCRKEREEARP